MKKILIILSMFTLNAFATGPVPYLQIYETDLSNKLSDIARSYDPGSFTTVKMTPLKMSVSLPLSGVNMEEIVWSDEALPKLKSLEITIFSSLSELPETFYRNSEKVLSSYKIKPHYEFQSIPSPKVDPNIIEALKPYFVESMASILGCILFISVIGNWLRSSQFKKVGSSIGEKISQLSNSLQNSNQENTSRPQIANKDLSPSFINIQNSQSDWDDRGEEFFVNILSDCYWCHEDAYAHFVWLKASHQMRMKILSDSSKWIDYIQHFSKLPPKDIYADQDIAYLNPLPIQGFDNSTLTKLIKKNPHLFGRLSEMRAQYLELEMAEIVKLMTEPKINIYDLNFLSSAQTSPSRIFNHLRTIEFKTVSEEESFFATIEDTSPHLKAAVLSLHWLTELPSKLVEEEFRKYTAKELAEAWIMMEKTKIKLESLIPERKRELLLSYLGNIKPHRKSSTFRALHKFSITHITTASEHNLTEAS